MNTQHTHSGLACYNWLKLYQILLDDNVLSPKIVISTDIPSFDLRSMSVSHRGKSLVSFVSASSLSSNSARFYPNRDKRVWVSALLMERRAKKSDCRATTRERTNTSLFFPRRRCLVIVCTAKTPFCRLLLFPRVALIAPSPSLPLLALRALTSQGNITSISIPTDIAGR